MWFRRRAVVEPAVPDRPIGFGYKIAWYAIRTARTEPVAAALNLARTRPCTWQEGIARIYDLKDRARATVFLTPPLHGWTLAAGWRFAPRGDWCDCPCVAAPLEALSKEFGEVQYFFTYRIIQMHIWAKAEGGYLRRAFGYFSDHSALRWVEGQPTRAEEELGLVFPNEPSHLERERLSATPVAEWPPTPDEESVMRMAGAWSINPSQLAEQYPEPSLGTLGVVA